MTTENYLIIEGNVVTNIVVWDGNTQDWQPPADSIQLIQATTKALIWIWDESLNPKAYVLKEQLGVGDINFTWNGSVLTTNEPMPTPPIPAVDQPATSGTTTI